MALTARVPTFFLRPSAPRTPAQQKDSQTDSQTEFDERKRELAELKRELAELKPKAVGGEGEREGRGVTLASSSPRSPRTQKEDELQREIDELRRELADLKGELRLCKEKKLKTKGNEAKAAELRADIRSKEGLLASKEGLLASKEGGLAALRTRLTSLEQGESDPTTPEEPLNAHSTSPSAPSLHTAAAAARPASKKEGETRQRPHAPPPSPTHLPFPQPWKRLSPAPSP